LQFHREEVYNIKMKQAGKKQKYCYRIPKYPLRAFMAYFYLIDQSNNKLFYPNTQIFTKVSEIADEAYFLEENLNSTNNFTVSDKVIIMPIILDRLYPLEERFWQKPTIHYDYSDRISMFIKILDNYYMYKLIVTPMRSKNKTQFVAAVPFFISTLDKNLEQFMLYSDFPVDESSKYAAIYELQKPLFLNWQTGEVEKINQPKVDLKKN